MTRESHPPVGPSAEADCIQFVLLMEWRNTWSSSESLLALAEELHECEREKKNWISTSNQQISQAQGRNIVSIRFTGIFFQDHMPADRADRSRGSDYDLSNTVTPSTERRSTSSRFTRDASTPESALTSLSPSPEPLPPPIVVRGHVLQPTVVFDTLWKWLVERKRIDDKRRAGMPAP
ncbi:hypothetical protein B0H11DRAFT_1915196 [Mycena galericulata]|nr:hypothetical protein B0H11DRAFT_1915196 [Mycena galericulata]